MDTGSCLEAPGAGVCGQAKPCTTTTAPPPPTLEGHLQGPQPQTPSLSQCQLRLEPRLLQAVEATPTPLGLPPLCGLRKGGCPPLLAPWTEAPLRVGLQFAKPGRWGGHPCGRGKTLLSPGTEREDLAKGAGWWSGRGSSPAHGAILSHRPAHGGRAGKLTRETPRPVSTMPVLPLRVSLGSGSDPIYGGGMTSRGQRDGH